MPGINMVNSNFYNVELRDRSGKLRDYLTPFATQVKWEWNRIGGCGRATIRLSMGYRKIEFSAGDDIQIRLRFGSTSKLVYRGWVSSVVPSMKINQDITLDVRGYFDRLGFLVVHDDGGQKTYTGQLVSAIVDDIIDSFVVTGSDITKGTIDTSGFAADSLSFKTRVSDALRTLAELEGLVEYGVDEDLVFFWRAQNDTLTQKFLVGDNVEKFERRIDWSKLLNKIYFEGGEVAGTKFSTTAEAVDSQNLYFLAESIRNNSAISTSSVADQYLSSLLRENSAPVLKLQVEIPDTKIRIEDTVPLGAFAVYDAAHDESLYTVGEVGDGGSDLVVGLLADGGSDATIGSVYQGQIDRISYSTSDTDQRVNMSVQLGQTILETAAKIKQIELSLNDLRQR